MVIYEDLEAWNQRFAKWDLEGVFIPLPRIKDQDAFSAANWTYRNRYYYHMNPADVSRVEGWLKKEQPAKVRSTICSTIRRCSLPSARGWINRGPLGRWKLEHRRHEHLSQ